MKNTFKGKNDSNDNKKNNEEVLNEIPIQLAKEHLKSEDDYEKNEKSKENLHGLFPRGSILKNKNQNMNINYK